MNGGHLVSFCSRCPGETTRPSLLTRSSLARCETKNLTPPKRIT